jgi:hypothetical protein
MAKIVNVNDNIKIIVKVDIIKEDKKVIFKNINTSVKNKIKKFVKSKTIKEDILENYVLQLLSALKGKNRFEDMRNMYNIKIKKNILFNKNDKLYLEINGVIKNTPYLTIKKYFHMGITKTGKNRKDLKIPKRANIPITLKDIKKLICEGLYKISWEGEIIIPKNNNYTLKLSCIQVNLI